MLSISALVASRHSLPPLSPLGRGRRRSRVIPSASSSRSTGLSRLALSATALTLLSINGVSASPSLPYIPTTILVPSEWPLDDSSSAPIKKGSINDNRAYIVTPRASGAGVDLLTLDFSNTLSTSSQSSTPQVVPIPSSSGNTVPPFLTGDAKETTFTPTILPNGTLAIITGDSSCSSSTNSAKIYTFSSTIAASASSPHPSGVWTSRSVTPAIQSSWDASESLNPYFYASGLSFSSQLAPSISEPVFYLYGGMCPYPVSDNSSSTGNWQSSATYSNKMLRISPDSNSKSQYTLAEAPSAGGPPVAEAGYTFTPLTPPSLATRSGGIITQQMSYVMLGGHTQSAFVNMSTAAVWSLPEESWTFVAIKDSEPGSGKVDLAIKDTHGVRITVPSTRKVDPRSGHSAVLSEDGSKLVVLGGWVGDLNTPAQPQLVILEVGGHGGGVGFEEWRWGIPPPALDAKKGLWQDGKGVYGHGAVLLPGNVMMVYGGYEIPGTGSKKLKKGRRGIEEGVVSKRQVSSKGVRFFNISSMEWQDEYTHPSASSSSPNSPNGGSNGSNGNNGNSNNDPEDKSTISSSSPKFLGLGVGLGVGIPVILALLLTGFCFRRRQLRHRAERDEALRGLAQGVPISRHGRHDSDEMMERNDPNAGIGFFPWNADTAQEWYTGGLDPYSAPTTANGRRRSLGYETLRGQGGRSGLYQPPPMPPAPLMTSNLFSGNSGRPRGSVARGLYQPTTGLDPGMGIRSPNSRSNRIHPIYEDDEDDDLEDSGDLGNGIGGGKHPLSPDADDKDDPFLTPTKEGSVGTGVYFPPPSSQQQQQQPPKSSGSGSSSSSTGLSEKQQQQQGQAQDPEVQGWVSDVDAADAVLSARISRHGSTTTRPPALKLSGSPKSGNGTGQITPTRPSPTRRTGSNKSGRLTPASAKDSQFDDGRTGSNLSDRSAFSFVQGAERAHIRSSHGNHPTSGHQRSQVQGGIDRSESSSSSSAHTFSTAKSNFAAMQAEGPSLLLGSGSSPRHTHPLEQELHQDDYVEDEEYDPTPGSPSKSKPVRRSWFGSLRRVFSGATPSPGGSSRGDSPTRDSLLGGNGGDAAGGDSSSRLLLGMNMGMGPNGVLLRRKQGREAWEEVLPGISGDSNAQGKDGEWDVEKAVEQRLVQVMFTVPKERLRVVNADLDITGDDASSLRHQLTHQSSRHEDLREPQGVAVLVDPERDGYGYPYQESLKGSVVVESVNGSSASVAEETKHDEEKGASKGKEKVAGSESIPIPAPMPIPVPVPVPVPVPGSVPPAQQTQQKPAEIKTDLLTVSDHLHVETPSRRNSSIAASGEGHSESGISPSASVRSAHTIHTAEMVRLERPRTRVLEMVESIESKSRDGSPSGSPVRGS